MYIIEPVNLFVIINISEQYFLTVKAIILFDILLFYESAFRSNTNSCIHSGWYILVNYECG